MWQPTSTTLPKEIPRTQPYPDRRYHYRRIKAQREGSGLVRPDPSRCALMPRSAWEVNSRKSISTILHSPHLWERRMADLSALGLIARHKI